MLADPLTVNADWTTITADAAENFSYTAIGKDLNQSRYRFIDADSNGKPVIWDLTFGHQYGRRNRFTARVTVTALMPNLLTPDNNSEFSSSCYVVVDHPPSGVWEPYEGSAPNIPSHQSMLKQLGSLLISVDTASPIMSRVVNGEL